MRNLKFKIILIALIITIIGCVTYNKYHKYPSKFKNGYGRINEK